MDGSPERFCGPPKWRIPITLSISENLPEKGAVRRKLTAAAEIVNPTCNEIAGAPGVRIEMRRIRFAVRVDQRPHAFLFASACEHTLAVCDQHIVEIAIAQCR